LQPGQPRRVGQLLAPLIHHLDHIASPPTLGRDARLRHIQARIRHRLQHVVQQPEPIGRLDQVDESRVEPIDQFNRMLDHYRAQRWDEADKILSTLAQTEPDSKLYKLFRQRIFELRYNPPGPNWNGIWVFKTK